MIVLTFNSREIIRRCLASLQGITYPNLEVLVVDNASADGTESVVAEEFPQVRLVRTGENLGYTGGNNRGLEVALESGADYAMLLNPDTVIAEPEFISRMIDYLEANPDIGIAGPRVFLRGRDVVQNTVLFAPGLLRSIGNWFRFRLTPHSLDLSGDSVVDAETLNGVCLLIRTKCLRDTGLFDENIFMYIEDADLDFRARKAGWRVCYLPIDGVIHEQRREGYEMTSLVSFLLRRNSVYFLEKIGRRFDAWGYAIGSIVLMSIRGVLNPARMGEYWRFTRRLASAYSIILRGLPLNEKFGPPYA